MARAGLTLAGGACLVLGLADVAWIDVRVAPLVFAARTTPPARAPAGTPPSAPAPPSAAEPPPAAAAAGGAAGPRPPAPAAHTAPAAAAEALTLLYPTSSDEISPSDAAQLDAVAQRLRRDPRAVALVEGHTDDRGTENANRALSARRATRVAAMLVARGVAPARIETRALGAARPLASNGSAGGQRLNRRVEIRLRQEGDAR